MNPFALPPSLLLTVFAYSNILHALPNAAASTSANNTSNNTGLLPSTGSGSSYANACASEYYSYSSAYTSWSKAHESITTSTELLGGTTISEVTYYENATTLCDGHPRVTYSPAIPLSTALVTKTGPITGTSTIVQTYFSYYPSPSPTCSIKPSDCDPLWKAYSKTASAASITGAPVPTPPCLNSSKASSLSSVDAQIYGCGKCTIYGEGVELVYFPTTASVDYCASTPTASLTHYGPGAVITAYAGKSSGGNASHEVALGNGTVIADGHTFTTNTAYISISKVFAVDRCHKTYGTPVSDAILAMPSESVLSLRYSQNHFQQLWETDKVTGYPVQYADFNTPIPWSAWNGQNLCQGPQGGYQCDVIYENDYRPQLAIPPGITDLSPDFKGCQMFYNGLWDPPLALRPAASAAEPTLPAGAGNNPAKPASAPMSPTAPATTLPNVGVPGPTLPATRPNASNGDPVADSDPSLGDPSDPSDPKQYSPAAEPWSHSFAVNGQTYHVTAQDGVAHVNGAAVSSGSGPHPLENGLYATYGQDGLVLSGSRTVDLSDDPSGSTDPAGSTAGPSVDDPSAVNGEGDPVGTAVHSAINGDLPVDGPPGSNDPSDPSSQDPSSDPNGNDPNGTDPHSNGDRDTATITINGHKAIIAQPKEGGPIIVQGVGTLNPGGPATTLPDGEVLSAAPGGLVIHWSSTLGLPQSVAAKTTAISSTPSTSTTPGAGRTTSGGSGNGAAAAAQTKAGASAQVTKNSAGRMSSSQALSFFAALLAMVFVLGG